MITLWEILKQSRDTELYQARSEDRTITREGK